MSQKAIRYLSLFSGVEAATLAWKPLGWKPEAFAEIDAFPSAVLAHHYPDIPNLGDVTQIEGSRYRGTVDLIVGGSPCQGFSIAGEKLGFDDPRSALALAYVRLLDEVRPRWFVWENVPGVISTNGGKDFRAFIQALTQLGYGCAWRVLDAQYVRCTGFEDGIPQRRKRIFVVGYLGDWRTCAKVLFESDSLPGDSESIQEIRSTTNRADGEHLEKAVTREPVKIYESPHTFGHLNECDVCPTLVARAGTGGGNVPLTITQGRVRQLTPLECERLMGFPDDYTKVPFNGKPADKCADSHRYKACGNSMCVNVMRWIGMQIQKVDSEVSDEHAR